MQNWSTRALERQIGSLYYERLLLNQDKAAVTTEAQANLAAQEQSPRAFVRDPVMLEFLGLPDTGRLLEAKLETGLMDKLQQFLMDLGKGFALVAFVTKAMTLAKHDRITSQGSLLSGCVQTGAEAASGQMLYKT